MSVVCTMYDVETLRRIRVRPVKERKPGSVKPFKRVIAAFNKINAVIRKYDEVYPVSASDYSLGCSLPMELSALPEYVGRGKGGKHKVRCVGVFSRTLQDRSMSYPHSSARQRGAI